MTTSIILCLAIWMIFGGWTSIETDEQEELLIHRPWNYNGTLEVRIGNAAWKSVEQNPKSCEKDDELHFGSHNTYEVTSGKVRCKGANDILKLGTWLITAKGQLIMDTYSLTINILNKDTLQITHENGKYHDRYTYVHK